MDKVDAIASLTRQNVRAPDPTAHTRAACAFGAMGDLVRRCDTYRLSVGADIDRLAGRIRAVLEG